MRTPSSRWVAPSPPPRSLFSSEDARPKRPRCCATTGCCEDVAAWCEEVSSTGEASQVAGLGKRDGNSDACSYISAPKMAPIGHGDGHHTHQCQAAAPLVVWALGLLHDAGMVHSQRGKRMRVGAIRARGRERATMRCGVRSSRSRVRAVVRAVRVACWARVQPCRGVVCVCVSHLQILHFLRYHLSYHPPAPLPRAHTPRPLPRARHGSPSAQPTSAPIQVPPAASSRSHR